MEKYDITKQVILKKGVYKLNDETNFNYQLNRVINWDGGRLEDVEKVSGKIHNSDDWKRGLYLSMAAMTAILRNFFSLSYICRNRALKSTCLKAPGRVA